MPKNRNYTHRGRGGNAVSTTVGPSSQVQEARHPRGHRKERQKEKLSSLAHGALFTGDKALLASAVDPRCPPTVSKRRGLRLGLLRSPHFSEPVLTRVLFFLSTHHSYRQAQEEPTNDHASIGLFPSLGISA